MDGTGRPYRPLRQGLDDAMAQLEKQGVSDACEQLKRAIDEKQLPIHIPGHATLTVREYESIDWTSVDCATSTIRCCLQSGAPSWDDVLGHKQPQRIEIAIADRNRLWPPTEVIHRHPGDAALVEEGKTMVANGMTKTGAARALAPRAVGGDIEQRVSRLRRLI